MGWKISYTILTKPRKDPYLEKMLSVMESTGFFINPENLPVRLVSGDLDGSYLKAYRTDDRFTVVDLERDEAKRLMWSAAGEALRETLGHHRCLHPRRANQGSDAVLVMEDDLIFGSGWVAGLAETVEEIVKVHDRRWLLSLYSPGSKEPLVAYEAGKRLISRPYAGFYGPQALLYPVGIRDSYMAYLKARQIPKPHDLALAEVMQALEVPMFSTAPCLVQHVEQAPEGSKMKIHHSESFIE